MTSRTRKRIYVFEKKPHFRAALETALATDDISISWFSEHRECLDRFATKPCDLLLVDLDGCEPEGIEMLAQARRMAPWVSTVAVVERAAVPCAIRAVKAGASDCLEKPVPQERLLSAVAAQLLRTEPSTPRGRRVLTQMEAQILQLILAGNTSYEMADILHRSKRTIDVHRKNIMRKLQATGLVDLVRRALGMGFTDEEGHDESAKT